MALDLGLGGKVAIISGGSEGLGRAAAERLAREGAKVAICARRKDVLEAAAEGIRKATSGEVLAIPADATKAADIENGGARRPWIAGAAWTSSSTMPAPRRRPPSRRWTTRHGMRTSS